MPKRKAATYDQIERRIRAAMWIAGLEFEDLAQRIDTPNLGIHTLRRLNASKKPKATKLHLDAIAEACGVTTAFFSVDFSQLQATDDQPEDVRELLASIELRLEALEREVSELSAGESDEDAPPQAQPQQ